MPRKARIDAPGALHHVIAGGIGRRKVFDDDDDRDFLLNGWVKLFLIRKHNVLRGR